MNEIRHGDTEKIDVTIMTEPIYDPDRRIDINRKVTIKFAYDPDKRIDIPSEKDDSKEYYDDNGKKYREGDKLLPDIDFEIRGYKYKTDNQGRVISAEGQLKMKDSDYTRKMEDTRKIDGQEYESDDDRGHLIGHQFNGSDKLENLVPMNQEINRKDFAKLENTLADAVKDGADVRLKVEPVYKGDSTRPSEFRVTYSIDDDKDIVVFKNESEAKT